MRKHLDEYHFVPDVILGVANGGVIPAQLMAYTYDKIPLTYIMGIKANEPTLDLPIQWQWHRSLNYLIVDDIFDSGKTYSIIRALLPPDHDKIFFAFMYRRVISQSSRKEVGNIKFPPQKAVFGRLIPKPDYLIFPWEYNSEKDVTSYFAENEKALERLRATRR